MDYLVQRKRFRDSKNRAVIHTHYTVTIPEDVVKHMGIDFDSGFSKDKKVSLEYDWATKELTVKKVVR